MVEQIWTKILTLLISSKSVKPKNFLKGFTFLEILIVLTLIILMIGLITPNFLKIFSTPYESEFKHIKTVIKILRNDAIIKNNTYCIIFDLKKQNMSVTLLNSMGKCSFDFLREPKILRPHIFSEELFLEEARIAEKDYNLDQNSSDSITIYINSSGFVTPFFLKFSSRDFSKTWKIESEGVMGKLK